MGRTKSDVDRVVFFSDAVFAIAITLLAIDLRIPAGLPDAELPEALRALLPRIGAFVLSFAVIGVFWLAHHRMWREITQWNQTLLLLNLGMLLIVAFVPFPTSMLGEYGDTVEAAGLYSGTMFLLGTMSAAIWWYASWGRHLVDPGLSDVTIRVQRMRSLVAPSMFGVAFVVALFSPAASQIIWWATFLVTPIATRLLMRSPKNAPSMDVGSTGTARVVAAPHDLDTAAAEFSVTGEVANRSVPGQFRH